MVLVDPKSNPKASREFTVKLEILGNDNRNRVK